MFLDKDEGRLAPPDDTRGVPAWLHAAVVRGLSPQPEGRFADMDAALAALVPRRTPLARPAVAAGVGLLAVAGTAAVLIPDDARRCEGGRAQIAAAWTHEQAQTLAARFEEAPAADRATWPAVQARLDAYAAGWAQATDDNCGAAKDDPPALVDRRRRCLHRRQAELAALVNVLEEGGARLTHAVSAVDGLRPVGACMDDRALAAPYDPPRGDVDPVRLDATRDALSRVHALLAARDHEATLRTAELAAAEAEAIGDEPLHAEAPLRTGPGAGAGRRHRGSGRLAGPRGEHGPSGRATRKSKPSPAVGGCVRWCARGSLPLRSRRSSRHWRRCGGPVTSACSSAFSRGAGTRCASRGTSTRQMPSSTRRSPLPSRSRMRRCSRPTSAPRWRRCRRRGATWLVPWRPTQAVRAVFERELGPRHRRMVTVLNHLAAFEDNRGNFAEAEHWYDETLAVLRSYLPEQHAEIADTLANQGGMFFRQERYEKALANARAATEIFKVVHGPKHPDVAWVRGLEASIYAATERFDEAVTAASAAVEIQRATLDPADPRIADGLAVLAAVSQEAGRVDDAALHWAECLRLRKQTFEQPHPHVALAHLGLARARAEQGRSEEAKTHAKAAAEMGRSLGLEDLAAHANAIITP